MENGLGYFIKKPQEIKSIVRNLLDDENRTEKLKKNISKLPKKALLNISDFIVKELEN